METSKEQGGGGAGGEEEMEKTKLCRMRSLLEKQDPVSSKEAEDETLRRFLRARNWEIEKSAAMFLKYQTWRRNFVPNGSILASEVTDEIGQNKMFLQGQDKFGRPIGVVLGSKHFQVKGGLDGFKRFVVYVLDKLTARVPSGEGKFVVIGDLQGWGFANSDIRAYIAALSILQDYYPERLGKMYMVHVSSIFMAVWRIICPFIDDKTKKKIVFVNNRRVKETLLEDIDISQLPEIYGGKLPLVPIQDT